MLVQGGRDRALARTTFADAIPDAVCRRSARGFVNHALIGDMLANLSFIREFLLEGELVRQNGIDRQRVERALTSDCVSEGKTLGATLNMVVVEAWLANGRLAS